jgi:ATP-dependent DNA helicase DinG
MNAKRNAPQTWEGRLKAEAREILLKEIEAAGGREVFAIAGLDLRGMINKVSVVARGSESAVPALGSYFEKGSVLIHNHPSGILFPSEADVQIAAEAGSYGVGSYIVDNEVANVYVVAEPARKKAARRLDEEGLAGALDKGGKLSVSMPSFEPRASQVTMTEDVAATFNNGGVLVAEAGTGVGKSFAYLLPALAWAQGNEDKVVVSTATINLQDQLFSKDIPLIASMFKKRPKAVLVKGRSNYLCSRRLREALEEEGLLVADDHPLRKIYQWELSGASGDRSDLPFRIDDGTWYKVCSEADACLSLLCPFREACHVIAVRKEAATAQIIVVNHHLLFADVSSRQRASSVDQTSILPSYSALILDEAHAIESSATSLFTESLTSFGIHKKMSRLYRKTRKGRFGSLSKLARLCPEAETLIQGYETISRDLFASLDDLEAGSLGLLGKEYSIRLKDCAALAESAFREPAGRVQRAMLKISAQVGDFLKSLPEEIAQEGAVYETNLAARSLNDMAELLGRLKDFAADPGTVFWLEKERNSQKEVYVSFNATPLEIAPLLEKSVFSKIRSVICTSATLAIGDSFDFWMRRIGIDRNVLDVTTKKYLSPFPFSSNALLAVDPKAPHPQSEKEAYKIYLGKAVPELLKASRGRALVLFTSYELLDYCYEKALPIMAAQGIACFKQGMDDRSKLLVMFKTDISSVLFATDSFWEGVDAPGETLSMVVISKLPFRVPSDPVQLARAEFIESKGGNAFSEISIPEAIIKFKQGFGRLIRHSEDRGVAVVLDRRLVSSRYGSLFLESLPRCRRIAEDLSAITVEIGRFLD